VEVTVKKLRKPAIVYKIAPSGNSELVGCNIVTVASVAKNAFASTFQSTFHLVSMSVFTFSNNQWGQTQFNRLDGVMAKRSDTVTYL